MRTPWKGPLDRGMRGAEVEGLLVQSALRCLVVMVLLWPLVGGCAHQAELVGQAVQARVTSVEANGEQVRVEYEIVNSSDVPLVIFDDLPEDAARGVSYIRSVDALPVGMLRIMHGPRSSSGMVSDIAPTITVRELRPGEGARWSVCVSRKRIRLEMLNRVRRQTLAGGNRYLPVRLGLVQVQVAFLPRGLSPRLLDETNPVLRGVDQGSRDSPRTALFYEGRWVSLPTSYGVTAGEFALPGVWLRFESDDDRKAALSICDAVSWTVSACHKLDFCLIPKEDRLPEYLAEDEIYRIDAWAEPEKEGWAEVLQALRSQKAESGAMK